MVVTAPYPPDAPGLPVFGHALGMARDPFGYLTRKYRELGPIFRIKLVNRRFTVLAGVEANQLLANRSHELFRSTAFWEQFGRTVNAAEFMISVDGEPHRRLRRMMKPGFSRQAVLHRLPEMVSLTREIADRYASGAPVRVVRLLQRVATQQLGVLLCDARTDDYFEDLRVFVNTILNVTVVHRWPRLMLHRPRFRRARRRAYEFARAVMADHLRRPRTPPDIIDDILAAHARGDAYRTDDELHIAVMGPFLAGMDTVANTTAFMLHSLLTHPQALARVRQDAAMLLGGAPTAESLKRCRALLGAVRETLRLYPVVPVVLRSAAKSFEFAGCRVDEGEQVMCAVAVTHYLPTLYENPTAFDIDRFDGEQARARVAGVFAPFGLGPHACLGSSLGELMMAMTAAELVHGYRFELTDSRLKVSVHPNPTPRTLTVRMLAEPRREAARADLFAPPMQRRAG
jgi:cytochrome P450